MPELGAGKQFILLSWRLDTLSGKCCNRDMGTQVRETSFNLRKRKEEGEKVGVAGGGGRNSAQKEEQAQKAARLESTYFTVCELHADQDF